jgi:hypothetical protein
LQLRTQLEFTRHYIDASRKLAAIAASSGGEYEYTTLEATREYIARHERPVITYEEALASVSDSA